jgi:phospholipase/carboxylesterase
MKRLFALVLILGGLYWWWSEPNRVNGPVSGYEFEYTVRTSGDGVSAERLPMVIALHGLGDTPENFYQTLLKDLDYPARFILLRGPLGHSGGKPDGRDWPVSSDDLREYGSALADEVPVLLNRFPTKGKPIIVGFSAGAYYAYYLAAFHADQFSFVFPISGGLPVELPGPGVRYGDGGAQVIAFHGKQDQVIEFQQGKAAVDNLTRMGIAVSFITFDGGHLEVFRSLKGRFVDELRDSVERLSR